MTRKGGSEADWQDHSTWVNQRSASTYWLRITHRGANAFCRDLTQSPMFDSVAIRAEAFKVLQSGHMPLDHLRHHHSRVVNLNTSLSKLTVFLGRVAFATLAKNFASIQPLKLSLLCRAETARPLSTQMFPA